MKESEYKYLLNKEEFEEKLRTIESLFSDCKKTERIQINYYYDTDSFELKKRGITLRVRQIDNNLRIQTKKHLSKDDGYVQCEEEEQKLDKLKRVIYLKNDDTSYTLQGQLVTNRLSYLVSEGIKVEFDSNYYLGVSDYEIEVEFLENKKDEVREILKLLNLPEKTVVNGKATRFFKTKKYMNM